MFSKEQEYTIIQKDIQSIQELESIIKEGYQLKQITKKKNKLKLQKSPSTTLLGDNITLELIKRDQKKIEILISATPRSPILFFDNGTTAKRIIEIKNVIESCLKKRKIGEK